MDFFFFYKEWNIIFVDFIDVYYSGESLTKWLKPKGLYVKFVNDSLEFTHR